MHHPPNWSTVDNSAIHVVILVFQYWTTQKGKHMGIGPFPDVAGGFVKDAVLSPREREILAELVRRHETEQPPSHQPSQS